MASKADLVDWLVECLEALGGTASLLDVSKELWQRHEEDLRDSGDLFYTWQYDLRWAATKLRKQGRLAENGPREPWRLVR